MSNRGLSEFDTTIQKTSKLLKEIEMTFGWPEERRNQSYAALRAVLHALRDRLPLRNQFNLELSCPC